MLAALSLQMLQTSHKFNIVDLSTYTRMLSSKQSRYMYVKWSLLTFVNDHKSKIYIVKKYI